MKENNVGLGIYGWDIVRGKTFISNIFKHYSHEGIIEKRNEKYPISPLPRQYTHESLFVLYINFQNQWMKYYFRIHQKKVLKSKLWRWNDLKWTHWL